MAADRSRAKGRQKGRNPKSPNRSGGGAKALSPIPAVSELRNGGGDFRVPWLPPETAQKIGFYVLLAYAALMVAPTGYSLILPGLDPSWEYALNHFANSPYKFGPDIIFTYGPLGFINYPQNMGWNLPIALMVRFVVWVILIAEIGTAFRQRRSTRMACFLAVLAVIFAHAHLRDSSDYMLEGVTLLLILRPNPGWMRSWRIALPLSLLCTIAFLAKESSYVTAMASLVAYFFLECLQERGAPSRDVFLRVACIILMPFSAYLLYNPSFSGLWSYVSGVAAIVGGYGFAMSSVVPPQEFVRIAAPLALILGFAAYAMWRRWLSPGPVAAVMAGLFMAVKHGVIRNGANLAMTYAFSMVLLAILILRCRDAKGLAPVAGGVFAAVCILSLTQMDTVWKTLSPAYWNPVPPAATIGRLAHWNRSMAADAVETEARLRPDRLPDEFLKRIQGDPVAIVPWELSYAPANHLNLLPLYTFQTYSTYTHELDLRTAANLANSPSRTKLLVEWKTIDDRHPLLDVPATWDEMAAGFAPAVSSANLLLFEKRDRPKQFHSRQLSRAVTDIRAWHDVPESSHEVRAAVFLRPTVFGTLRNILFKTDSVYLELEPDQGDSQRFRVIPDVLSHPFALNCLPLNYAALESIMFENRCPQKIKRFRFSGEGLASFPSFAEIEFTESTDVPPEFPKGWQDATIPLDVPMAWVGVVDAFDGAPIPGGNSAASPLIVARGKKLEISGWAASAEKAGEAFEGIFLIAGKRQLRAISSFRPDVAAYLQDSRLSRSGFQIYVDTADLQSGDYGLEFVGVTRAGMYYRRPNQIFLRIQ